MNHNYLNSYFCNAIRYLQFENGDLVGSTEEMANRVMANLIKQLASLGRHAHDIFGKPYNSVKNGKIILHGMAPVFTQNFK